MSNKDITKEEIQTVFPKVAETMADALGCDLEQIKPDASLIDDLKAESIDFLDIVFRLERAFKVKIPRGKIVEEARGELSETQLPPQRWWSAMQLHTLFWQTSLVPHWLSKEQP